ncbi:MAG: molybdopterin converting factor [Verrucomicrobiales bacterium]|nr:molybdopterin converting factor [Verrucomicrobiales bacterium]|tara:strand:+ start:60686 stop:61084 length:399 start_codon:yes stop_codon:yes gene_type:complete
MTTTHLTCSISKKRIEEIERSYDASCVHGADLRFHGVVRNLEEGQKISGIEYSHYDKMALNELQKIGVAMGRKYPDHLAQIHHRLGFVPTGEASIVIRIQTARSAQAFEISREYLKRIKQTVPIWKKPVLVG